MFFYLWMMVQVICESLPISSSGHVTLLHSFVNNLVDSISLVDAQAFDYFLQGVSAIVFLIYFFVAWWQLVIKQPIAMAPLFDGHVWKKNILPVLGFGFIVDGMTALLWCINLKDFIKIPLIGGFFFTAAMLWSMRYAQEKKGINIWSLQHGLILGSAQGFALLPGVSRFATTLATLQWLGYNRSQAFAISFLVQWPLIVAGSLKGFLELRGTQILTNILTMPFLLAIVCSMIVSYGVMCAVGKLVDKNCLWKFSYYMMIPLGVALFI